MSHEHRFLRRGETQGKCPTCRVRFIWKGRPRLYRALCSKCGTPLEQTTHVLRWSWIEATPNEVQP